MNTPKFSPIIASIDQFWSCYYWCLITRLESTPSFMVKCYGWGRIHTQVILVSLSMILYFPVLSSFLCMKQSSVEVLHASRIIHISDHVSISN